ncbi:hypothetical protein O181_043997, partial [Austropuccinia psidii MF-1]|nr:hypothetical protein [Austropuccinia psidii MF-1]
MQITINISNLIAKAPNNTNPFNFALELIYSQQNPTHQSFFTTTLLCAGANYLLISLTCLAIMALPWLQLSGAQTSKHWIFSRRYLGNYSTPYWVPNTGFIVAACQLLGSIMFEIYIFLSYRSLKDGRGDTTSRDFPWVEMRWYAPLVGFFVQAWSTLYIRASEEYIEGANRRHLLLHPIFFNTVLASLPTTMLCFSIYFITSQTLQSLKLTQTYQVLIQSLKFASDSWDSGHKALDLDTFSTLDSNYSNFLLSTARTIFKTRQTGLFWTTMGIPIVIFYVFGASTLIRKLKKCHQVLTQASTGSSTNSDILKMQTKPNLPAQAHIMSSASQKLKNFYTYLGLHYILMTLTISYDVILGLFYFLQSDEDMGNPVNRARVGVLSLSASVLLLISLLVQLVRVLLEGRHMERTEGKSATDIPSLNFSEDRKDVILPDRDRARDDLGIHKGIP